MQSYDEHGNVVIKDLAAAKLIETSAQTFLYFEGLAVFAPKNEFLKVSGAKLLLCSILGLSDSVGA